VFDLLNAQIAHRGSNRSRHLGDHSAIRGDVGAAQRLDICQVIKGCAI
jgi:hypothetical protein